MIDVMNWFCGKWYRLVLLTHVLAHIADHSVNRVAELAPWHSREVSK